MGNESSKLIHKNRRPIKCYLAVNYHCQQALLEVVHDPNYNGLPKNEEELYQFFNKAENRNKIKKLQKQKVLKDDQVELLLPQNQRTFSEKWDVTLICVVIINFTDLPPPIKGWRNPLDPTDVTVAAFVVMARQSRNKNNHSTLATFLEQADCDDFLTEMRKIVNGLKYSQIAKFEDLAIDSFDQNLFKNDVASFMKNITNPNKKDNVISEVLRWLKEDNEKGWLFLFYDSLIIFYCTGIYTSSRGANHSKKCVRDFFLISLDFS